MSRGSKQITVSELGNITSGRWRIVPGPGSSTRTAGFQPTTLDTYDPTATSHADESSNEARNVFPTDSQPVTPGIFTPTTTPELVTPGPIARLTPLTVASPEASQLGDSFGLGDIFGDTFDIGDVINAIEAASQPALPPPHGSVPQRPQRIGLFGSTGLYTTHGLRAYIPTAVADPPRGPTYIPSTRHTTFNAAETRGVVASPRSPSQFNSNDTTVWATAPSPLQQTKRTLGGIGNSGLYSTRGPEAEIAGRGVNWVAALTNFAAHLAEERAKQEAKKQISLPECAVRDCYACPFFEMMTKGMLSKTTSGLSLWGALHKLQAVCNCSVFVRSAC